MPKTTWGEPAVDFESDRLISDHLQGVPPAQFEFLGFHGEGVQRTLAIASRPSFTDEFLIYAEVALPEGSTAAAGQSPGSDDFFGRLDFAFYLGSEKQAQLLFASTDELPLRGTRTVAVIPSDSTSSFEYAVRHHTKPGTAAAEPGDLLIVTSPNAPMGGTLADRLPVLLLALSLLAVAAVAVVVEVIQRRRDDALRLVADLEAKNAALDRALTSEQEAQDALEASRERFERIMAGSPDVLLSVDALTQEITLLNRQDFFGHPFEELRRVGGLRTLVHPDDLEAYDDFAKRVAAAHFDDVVESMFRLGMPGGEWDWVRSRVKVIEETEENQPLQLLAILTVITAEREAQAAHARLQEQLRQAQRLEAVGQLAGGIAHDFNNLLAVILSYSGFVTDELGPEHPARADVDEIAKAARRAAELTGQLLTFSRKQVVEPRVLCLNDVVIPLEKILERTLGENIDLSVRLSPDLGPVDRDPGQIEQVLMNLAVNARDAISSDHGTLVIETTNVSLDARYADQHPDIEPGDYVCLSVSDSGTGMTPDVVARAFEPFFTTKGPSQGTGMGLATVYGIVRGWGGTTTIYSEPGHGTTVRVYLPVAHTGLSLSRPAPTEAPAAANGEVVLVVEDEPGVRSAAKRILEKGGYTVLDAGDGAEALERCETARVDLLLTDVVMPGGCSGRDLARQLPHIPVVYMSGYTADVVGHQGVLDPGTTLVQKPFTEITLLTAVADVLHGTAVGGKR